jgi:hypothetical protein
MKREKTPIHVLNIIWLKLFDEQSSCEEEVVIKEETLKCLQFI